MTPKQEVLSLFVAHGFAPGRDPVPIDEEWVLALINDLGPFLDPAGTGAMVAGEHGEIANQFVGVDGFVRTWNDWLASFDRYQLSAEHLFEAGDYIVGLGRQSAVSATAGIEVEDEAALVCTMPGRAITRVEFHLAWASALRSAGLDPADYNRQE